MQQTRMSALLITWTGITPTSTATEDSDMAKSKKKKLPARAKNGRFKKR
jgi:hypothetical protein